MASQLLRIVFVGPFGLQPKGTMNVRALPMAKALTARGHQVTMLIPPWDDPERAGKQWTEDGVEIINISLPPRIPGLFQVWLTRSLVAQTMRLKPHIVHLFKPKAYAGLAHLVLWSLRELRLFSAKLLLDTDDWEQAWNEIANYSKLQKAFFAWQEQWGLQYADAVTVASRALENLVRSHRWQDKSIFYVPNGRPRRFSQQTALSTTIIRQKWELEEGPIILLYSRFLEFRLSRIITMVQHVAQKLPHARWLMVGQGLNGEEKRLQRELELQGLAKFVRFTGWVDASKLPLYFKAADVAIYPYDDTLINRTKCAVKLIDLLAAGVPVVADGLGQNNEYIKNGQSGILVPPEDDLAFSRAIVELIGQPQTRQKMSQAARQRIEADYTWKTLVDKVEQAYVTVS